MTSNSLRSGLKAKKARNARRKRLATQRMNSVSMIPEIDSPFTEDGEFRAKKRCIAFKEVALSESSSEPKIHDDEERFRSVPSKSDPGSSGSSVPSLVSGGSPAGVLVGGEAVCEEEEPKSLADLTHGSVSVLGRRRMMEDAVVVEPKIAAGEFAFFAVYDGHGGARVANACRNRLHRSLELEIERQKRREEPAGGGGRGGIDWEKVMVTCFATMDEEVNVGGGDEFGGDGEGERAVMSMRTTGSTAVVVVVGKEEIVVANCGDSRAVLYSGGVVMPLSHDHKPDRPDERQRVEAAGGRIINWNGRRVQGVLATSRSIGDHYLKPYVISEPEVTVRKRIESDEFLIIASDGLWDVVSNYLACEVTKRCLDGQIRRFSNGSCPSTAAAILAELAIAKGSKDNVSVIVVGLKKSGCKIP